MAPKPEPKKVRGVYEHPKGSEIWWIQYFDQGRRHRERVGTKGNAIRLYQKRKTQILSGDKLPELSRRRVTMGELMDDAISYAREHNSSSNDQEKMAKLLKPTFGTRPADAIKPDEIAAWVRARKVAPATFNRYRSFFSLCYREGMRHGKVQSNPARLLAQKREPQGRKRFLSRDEYAVVVERMTERWPQYVPAFVLSVHTGMRLSEQYRLAWKHVDLDRREIQAVDTKNGESRTIPLTSVAYEQLALLRPAKIKAGQLVFPRVRGGKGTVQPRWFDEMLQEDAVGVHDYTWHNNRHTFCSWLAIAGVPLKTIQELAGHKTLSITARYAHLSPDHKSSEIEKLVATPKPKVVEIRSAIRTAIG